MRIAAVIGDVFGGYAANVVGVVERINLSASADLTMIRGYAGLWKVKTPAPRGGEAPPAHGVVPAPGPTLERRYSSSARCCSGESC